MSDERVAVGTKILFRIILILVGIYFLFLIRSVLLLVLFAVLTSAAVSPVIRRLERWRLSRTASVIIVYAVLFFGSITVLAILVPLFFSEIKEFLSSWPDYVARLDTLMTSTQSYLSSLGVDFQKDQFTRDIGGNITGWLSNILSTTVGLFQGFIHFIGFFFLALYLSLEEQGIEKFFLLVTPKEYHEQTLSIVSRMRGKVSQWLFGQMLLMLIAFVMYYIGLKILGVPYALAIAFFGGIMEILPYIGPVIAAIPAILVGLLVSPVLGLSAFVFYVVAHQAEAHIVAPQVMKHSAGLNPVALIIAVLVGAELAGPVGIVLSVPVTMMLSVFVDDLLVKKQA